jgi:hypothetical protein
MLYFIRNQIYIGITLLGIGMAIAAFLLILFIMTFNWNSFDVYENGLINPMPLGKAFNNNPFKKGIFYHFEDITEIYTHPMPRSGYTRFVIKTKDTVSGTGTENEDADEVLKIILDTQKRYHLRKQSETYNETKNLVNKKNYVKIIILLFALFTISFIIGLLLISHLFYS